MGKIKILSAELSQKIAAGEVIERPFSVVKELVENSLDAGATEIRVEVVDGGKKLVKVEDNGCGLSLEDIAVCFERFATSKIWAVDDLERIATLGFRGEALASIDAVSKLTLKTSEGGGGIKVEREAGRLIRLSEGAYPRGTSVEVRDLFFNLPVRRKFLRSAQSELTHIARYLTTVALAFPEVSFSLYHSQRQLLHCPAVGSRRERFYQLFGRQALERMVEFDWEEGDYRVSGLVSRPPFGFPDRQHQFFYVNRRPVRDRTLTAAIQQAVKGWLEKDNYPEVYLFLKIPYSEVDVNVHPTKAEVRFRDPLRLFQSILCSLDGALKREAQAKAVYAGPEDGLKQIKEERPIEKILASSAIKKIEAQGASFNFFFPSKKIDFMAQEEEKPETRSWQVLGQYLNFYIVIGEKDSLLIIDQHNAHERVLFEKYLELDRCRAFACRQPLFPLVLELSPAEMIRLEEIKAIVAEIGFEIESLGGRSLLVRAFPDFLEEEEVRQVLLGFLEEHEEARLSEPRQRLLATMACRTAIKAGAPLNQEKMEALVAELFLCDNPWLCPHGRPTTLRLERREIERALRRPLN